jgi:sulfur carrier protein
LPFCPDLRAHAHHINQQSVELPANATVADAVAQWQAKPPFAVAVNTGFVPRGRYAAHALAEGDQVEIIAPVTGG